MSPRLAEETVAADEAATIAEFIAFLQESSARRPRAPGAPIGRFNQARAAGCVEAEFVVPADLPAAAEGGAVRPAGHLPGARAVCERHLQLPTASAISAACR